MLPGANTPINILKNEPIRLFAFLNDTFAQKGETEIEISYYDSSTKKRETHVLKVDKK